MQISAPTMCPPVSPKMCSPAISATSSWPAILLDGRRVEEDGVKRDVEGDDDQRRGDDARAAGCAADRSISPAM